MNTLDARLLESFAQLPFGASTKEAEQFFGKPEETETLEAIDGSVSLVWHYWSKGFTLFFDQARNNRFCCVEVDSSVPLKLWDLPVFTLNEPQLKDLCVKNGFKDIDEEHHEWGEKRVTFDDAMADFYFENGILVSVNYGVAFPGEGELITSN